MSFTSTDTLLVLLPSEKQSPLLILESCYGVEPVVWRDKAAGKDMPATCLCHVPLSSIITLNGFSGLCVLKEWCRAQFFTLINALLSFLRSSCPHRFAASFFLSTVCHHRPSYWKFFWSASFTLLSRFFPMTRNLHVLSNVCNVRPGPWRNHSLAPDLGVLACSR